MQSESVRSVRGPRDRRLIYHRRLITLVFLLCSSSPRRRRQHIGSCSRATIPTTIVHVRGSEWDRPTDDPVEKHREEDSPRRQGKEFPIFGRYRSPDPLGLDVSHDLRALGGSYGRTSGNCSLHACAYTHQCVFGPQHSYPKNIYIQSGISISSYTYTRVHERRKKKQKIGAGFVLPGGTHTLSAFTHLTVS